MAEGCGWGKSGGCACLCRQIQNMRGILGKSQLADCPRRAGGWPIDQRNKEGGTIAEQATLTMYATPAAVQHLAQGGSE